MKNDGLPSCYYANTLPKFVSAAELQSLWLVFAFPHVNSGGFCADSTHRTLGAGVAASVVRGTLPLCYHQIPAKIGTLSYSVHSGPQTVSLR